MIENATTPNVIAKISCLSGKSEGKLSASAIDTPPWMPPQVITCCQASEIGSVKRFAIGVSEYTATTRASRTMPIAIRIGTA